MEKSPQLARSDVDNARMSSCVIRFHMPGFRALLVVAGLGSALVAACGNSSGAMHEKARYFQSEGARAFQRGELDRAAGQCSLALEYEPKMPEARNCLGLVAQARGDIEGAEKMYRESIRLNEDFAEGYVNLGYVLQSRRDYEGAIENFRQALAIDPGYGLARLAVGETLIALGRFDEARWELAKLVEIEPKNAGAHAAYARVLNRMQRPAAATEAVEKALSLDPNLPLAHRARAEILFDRGDLAGAAEEYRQVLAAEPNSLADRTRLVRALGGARRYEEAERELYGLEQAAPTVAEVAWLRAWLSVQQGRFALAIGAARRALQLQPNYPEAVLVLGEALLGAGQLEEGRKQLERFLQVAPPSMERQRQKVQQYLKGQ